MNPHIKISGRGFLGGSVGLCLAVVVVQVLVAVAFSVRSGVSLAEVEGVFLDGDVLALTTLASTLIAVPFMLWIARSQTRGDEFEALGLVGTTGRWVAVSAGLAAAYVVLGDVVLRLFGVDTLSEDITAAYRSAWLPTLWLAIVIAAPIVEEMYFRGYAFAALRRTRLGMWGTAVLTSVAWAALHVTYPIPAIALIAVMGIALTILRERSGSVLPCMAMHVVVNAVALFQTHWFVRGSEVAHLG